MAATDTLRRARRSYATYVVLGVVIGLVAAPVLAGAAPFFFGAAGSSGSDGVVAVVPIQGTIDGETATRVQTALSRARADGSIDAVVLVANSGGGAPAASEEMYFAVKRAQQSGLPVVASVDGVAASGAYYAIAPADRIFVKPGSLVGSVGVFVQLPTDVQPNDIIGATGPDKLSGGDTREFLFILESLQRAFVNAVLSQRGDNLTLTRSELEAAQIYSGGQAVGNGVADEIGDRSAAVQAAAERAGLDDYSVRVLGTEEESATFVSRSAFLASDADAKRLVTVPELLGNQTGGPTFLMIGGVSPSAVATDRTLAANAVEDSGVENGTDGASPSVDVPAPPTGETAPPVGEVAPSLSETVDPAVRVAVGGQGGGVP